MTETEYVCPVGHVLADPTAPCEACALLVKAAALHDALVQRKREMWPALRQRREYAALCRMEKTMRGEVEAGLVALGGVPLSRWERVTARVRSVLRRRGSASGRRA